MLAAPCDALRDAVLQMQPLSVFPCLLSTISQKLSEISELKFFFFSLLLLVSCRSVKKSQEHTQLFQQRDSVEAYHEYRGESLLREWHSQESARGAAQAA